MYTYTWKVFVCFHPDKRFIFPFPNSTFSPPSFTIFYSSLLLLPWLVCWWCSKNSSRKSLTQKMENTKTFIIKKQKKNSSKICWIEFFFIAVASFHFHKKWWKSSSAWNYFFPFLSSPFVYNNEEGCIENSYEFYCLYTTLGKGRQ